MRIAFFETQDWEKPYLEKSLATEDLYFFKDPLNEDNVTLVSDCDIISVFIYSQVGRAIIDKLRKTRLIATRSTGFDHIDIQACRIRDILVCNVPLYGEVTVAEHTFALILSLSRNIHDSYERTRLGDFSCPGIQGFDINRKILGVLGTGRIGSKVIEIAKGFNMQVIAYDKFPNAKLAEALDFRYVEWQELLAISDIVTLHLPYNKETHHFLNKETIGKMKQGSVIINTARGGLIDSKALTEALVSGHLRGAGLDVLEEETLIREEAQLFLDNVPREQLATMLRAHILLKLKNVIITPHCGFNSKESLERLINGTIKNVRSFIAGRPQNKVS